MRIEEAHACNTRNLRVVIHDVVHTYTLLPVPDAARHKVKLIYVQ